MGDYVGYDRPLAELTDAWDEDEHPEPWHDSDVLAEFYGYGYTQQEIADELGCSRRTISRHLPDDAERGETGLPYEDIALFSGGNDSLVSTHYCMENDLCDVVLHLDTGTGIDENLEFVRETCEQFGWPLEVRETTTSLKEFALEYGFPKASSHSWAYRYFKEHTIDQFTTELACDHPRFYTGVWQGESDRRMRTVEAKEQESYHGRWTWIAPCLDWTESDFLEYREEHDLPKNPVAENVCRSGECYCGAYANRVEELSVLQAEYPDHAEWLLEVEEEVQEEIGTEEDYCWWGASGMPADELQELMEDAENSPLMLCVDCEAESREGDA